MPRRGEKSILTSFARAASLRPLVYGETVANRSPSLPRNFPSFEDSTVSQNFNHPSLFSFEMFAWKLYPELDSRAFKFDEDNHRTLNDRSSPFQHFGQLAAGLLNRRTREFRRSLYFWHISRLSRTIKSSFSFCLYVRKILLFNVYSSTKFCLRSNDIPKLGTSFDPLETA